jgi:hypothetical protein
MPRELPAFLSGDDLQANAKKLWERLGDSAKHEAAEYLSRIRGQHQIICGAIIVFIEA